MNGLTLPYKRKTKLNITPISVKQFEDICGNFTVEQRKKHGSCDDYTLSCYRDIAKDKAKQDFAVLQKMGLVLVLKEKLVEASS